MLYSRDINRRSWFVASEIWLKSRYIDRDDNISAGQLKEKGKTQFTNGIAVWIGNSLGIVCVASKQHCHRTLIDNERMQLTIRYMNTWCQRWGTSLESYISAWVSRRWINHKGKHGEIQTKIPDEFFYMQLSNCARRKVTYEQSTLSASCDLTVTSFKLFVAVKHRGKKNLRFYVLHGLYYFYLWKVMMEV